MDPLTVAALADPSMQPFLQTLFVMQLLLYYADVRGRPISDRVVRHDIQPWSSIKQPEFGRPRRFVGVLT